MCKFNLIVYVVFITSGIIKSFIYVDFFPFDLTLMTAVYCVGVILFEVVISRGLIIHNMHIALALLFLFYIWLTFSLMYTPSLSYAYEKYALSYLNLVAFCYPVFCKFYFKIFTRAVILISIILLVAFVYFRLNFSSEFMTDNNLKSIYLSFGVLLGFALVLTGTIENRFKSVVFWVLFLGLIVSAARGPLLFYLLSVSIVKLAGIRKERGASVGSRVPYFLVPFFILILLITNVGLLDAVLGLLQTSIDRFSAFLLEDGGDSVGTRFELFSQAFHMFSENIFLGNGLGSFGLYVTGADVKLYPHNIILELLSELGLISVVILFFFILSIYKNVNHSDLVVMVFLYSFMNVMKSNSFEELRLFFGFLGVALLYEREFSVMGRNHKFSLFIMSNK